MYSSYDTFQDGMYHPKGEMNVSVMIVYVHKACEIKQRDQQRAVSLVICYAQPLKIGI